LPRPRHDTEASAELLALAAPLVTRWVERALALSDPPLSLAQFLALETIGRTATSVTELARVAGVSEPAASQLVAGLEERGLIRRTPSFEDRRRHSLELSEQGEEALRAARTLIGQLLAPLLADLKRPELAGLERLLFRLIGVFGATGPPRPPKGAKGRRQPKPGRRAR
jgi:DNA-binding MarR family transcriptional regulator